MTDIRMVQTEPNRDHARRVPDREALLLAALPVVEQAGTAAVTLAAIAAHAGVDADVASALFPDVDGLLIDAALAMCIADLGLATDASAGIPTVSAYATHFARRRVFYRAMRIGGVAAALDARMAQLVTPLIEAQVRVVVGSRLTEHQVAELTLAVTVESFEITNRWIVESPATAGAESLYVQLEAIVVRGLEHVREQRD